MANRFLSISIPQKETTLPRSLPEKRKVAQSPLAFNFITINPLDDIINYTRENQQRTYDTQRSDQESSTTICIRPFTFPSLPVK